MSELEGVGDDDGPSSGASGVLSPDAVVPSAGGSSAGGGGGAAVTPAADGRVARQLGIGATTFRSSNGVPVTVTIDPQTSDPGDQRPPQRRRSQQSSDSSVQKESSSSGGGAIGHACYLDCEYLNHWYIIVLCSCLIIGVNTCFEV